jgi:GNAT superfamily N-acetyltransferase
LTIDFRPLTVADRDALESFYCSVQRVTHEVEDVIQGLADSLDFLSGTCSAWDGPKLAGVVAWQVRGDAWRIVVLGVSLRYQRQGLGRVLKAAVIDEARSTGAARVLSVVHEDNVAMARLNQRVWQARPIREPGSPYFDYEILL